MRDESRQPSEPGFLKGVPHMEPGFLKGVPHRCRLKRGRVPTMLAQKGKTVLQNKVTFWYGLRIQEFSYSIIEVLLVRIATQTFYGSFRKKCPF